MATPQPPDRRDVAITTAKSLTNALNGVSDRLDEVQHDSEERDEFLRRYGRRNRLLILVATIGLLFDIAGTTVGIVALVKVSHNSATIGQVHQSNLQGCQVNNTRLANQAKALDSILEAVAPPSTAPLAQRQAAAAFEARAHAAVKQGWSPRNCSVAYKLPGGR